MDRIEHKKGKIYYSMGEVAEMFDVNASLIRFWESKFDILKPHKNKKGNRMFTPADVDNLKLIYHLVKEKGMTLAGARKRLKENPEGISRDMEVVDRLMGIRAILEEIRAELTPHDGEVYHDEEPGGGEFPPGKRATDPDELLDTHAEALWVDGQLDRIDELDENIEELAAEAGISEAEADQLLEEDEELPVADSGIEKIQSGGSEGDPEEITEEELALLDDEPEPDYPGEDYAAFAAAEQSLFDDAPTAPAPEEEQKPLVPRIVEQTLF